ncbi:MAG: NblA/ycf18 family protein [Thermosynechococcaceae cyanobacterium]
MGGIKTANPASFTSCGMQASHSVPFLMEQKSVSEPVQLSLEQQFKLRSFMSQVKGMSQEQAQEFLVQLYEQMIVRETIYKEILKNEWQIGNPVF